MDGHEDEMDIDFEAQCFKEEEIQSVINSLEITNIKPPPETNENIVGSLKKATFKRGHP